MVVVSAELGRVSNRVSASAAHPRLTSRSEIFDTPTGKRRHHAVSGTALTLRLGRSRLIEVFVADDGIAFRQTGAGQERVAWRAAVRSRAWLQTWKFNYENPYRGATLSAHGRGSYAYPALLATPKGDYALLTEAALPYGLPRRTCRFAPAVRV